MGGILDDGDVNRGGGGGPEDLTVSGSSHCRTIKTSKIHLKRLGGKI